MSKAIHKIEFLFGFNHTAKLFNKLKYTLKYNMSSLILT